MFIKEIIEILENQIAPIDYCRASEFYGIQYGTINENKIIKKVLITMDLNLKVIHFAIKNKINLIISQLSLLEKPIFKINKNLINKLNLLSKYPLCIYILNSSYIASENGVSETISNILYLKIDSIFEIKNKNRNTIPIGRICHPKRYPNKVNDRFVFKTLLERVRNNFDLNFIRYVGELEREITKICILPIENDNNIYIEKALKYKCDCLICSSINYNQASFARETGISLISIPYYKTTLYSLKKLYNYLSLEFPNEGFLLFEQPDPIDYYYKP